MTRVIAAVIAGLLTGIGATSLFVLGGANNGDLPENPATGYSAESALEIFTAAGKPQVAASQVSFEQILMLPSVFERSTALHMLASQSDVSDVQNLIFETNEIVNEFERDQLLHILFARLTELEPRTALQLARSESFFGVKSIERSVWRGWALSDFDDALFEAKAQASNVGQKSAAQGLYFAFGYLGNEHTDRIEAELGIEPDRFVRSLYLYMLADKSIADAIDFVNDIDDEADRRQYVSLLAHYASLGEPHDAVIYASHFSDKATGDYYESVIQSDLAREDPHAAIERLLAADKTSRSSAEFHSAVSALVKVDLRAAQKYFEQSRSTDARRTLGVAIASEMAKESPEEAVAWARDHDTGRYSSMQMAVLQRIARTDPQLALNEALKTGDAGIRLNMVSSVVYQISRGDPQEAAMLLAQVPDKAQRLEASQSLAHSWLRSDPDTAINWILSQDDEIQAGLVQMAASRIAHTDIDAAIRLLPRLDEKMQPGVRQQIALQLAQNGSVAEAQNFIQQFDDQPGFEQLRTSVISGVARTDVTAAKQMADQLTEVDARDHAYVEIISRRAEEDPAGAVDWLGNISNDAMRGSASGQIAAQWARRDAAAAEGWVSEMPSGTSRDGAILHMASLWKEPSAAQHQLINSIENRDMRSQAKLQLAYNYMHTDIERARELLRDADIPQYQRQQAELIFSRLNSYR